MPHLDAELFIEELWGQKLAHTTGDRHPTKDGWPVYRTQYHIASLSQDVRVHSYMNYVTKGAAHNCRDVEISAKDLLRLAKLLKWFATDRHQMFDFEEFDDTMFGFKSGSERWEADLKYRMANARALSKKIRKAARYIQKRQKEEGDTLRNAWVYAVYRCHW